MSDLESRVTNLENLKPGMTVKIVNRTSKSQQYTFDNGEFGKVSFTLIIGSECFLTLGTQAPVITIDSPDLGDAVEFPGVV